MRRCAFVRLTGSAGGLNNRRCATPAHRPALTASFTPTTVVEY